MHQLPRQPLFRQLRRHRRVQANRVTRLVLGHGEAVQRPIDLCQLQRLHVQLLDNLRLKPLQPLPLGRRARLHDNPR